MLFRKKHRRHKLSAHLLTLFLVTGLLLILIITGLFRGALRHQYQDALRPHLTQYFEYIKQDIGIPPDLVAAARLAERLPIDIAIIGSEPNWSSLGSPIMMEQIEIYHRDHRQGAMLEFGEYGDDRFLVRTTAGDYSILLITESFEKGRRGFLVVLLMIALVVLVLFASYRVMRWMLKPIEILDKGVRRIGEGELEYRIDVNRRDELGALAASVNQMAGEIQAMLEAKRQLLLAISHELRSPLTRANVSLALMGESPLKDDVRHDLAEVDRLIEELLEAERLNSRHSILNLEDVAVDELLNEVISENFPEADVDLQLRGNKGKHQMDPVRIKLLLRNLVDNAIKHNRHDSGTVRIEFEENTTAIRFIVSDHGEGFHPDDIEHATEPFWRKDQSRSRSTGGFGLGLYLCRRIVEAHGGVLEIESDRGNGTRVVATLPGTH